jgi:branched-chain amino acid aminotransferase
VLPGVTRAWVLDWAEANGTPVRKKMVTIDEVLGADEVLLTNSSWGVMPIVKVEREAIGDGVVGEIGNELVKAWREAIGDA